MGVKRCIMGFVKDVVVLIGFFSLCYGLYLTYIPAAFIVAGILILSAATVSLRGK